MPIDPRINLSVFANQPDFGEIIARGRAMQDANQSRKLRDMQIAEMQRRQAEDQAVRQAAAGAVTPQQTQQVNVPGISLGQYGSTAPRTDNLTTPPQFDRSKMLSNLAGDPQTASLVPQYQSQFDQQDQQQAAAQHKQQIDAVQLQEALGKLDAQTRAAFTDATDQVGRAAGAILQSQDKAGAYQQALQQLQQSPNPMVQKMIAQAPPQYQPGMDGWLNEQLNHAMTISDIAKRVNPEPAKPNVTPGVGVPFSPEVAAQKIKIAQASRPVTAPLPGGAMSEDAKDMAAQMYLQTGNLPSLGMGKDAAELRRDILNRAAALGKGQNVAANKADYGANSAALKQVVGMKNAVEAYESTAGKNLDLFIEQAKNVPDTGIPILNAPTRALAEKMGSDKVAAYNAARQVAVTEIARVVNNPNLTGQLSDSARNELSSFNPSSATLAQTLHIAQVLRADMKNRHDSLVEQEKQLKGHLGGGNSQQPAPSGGGIQIQRDAQGRIIGVN
jgi:hypothetical protein